jgi:hypothetical protein
MGITTRQFGPNAKGSRLTTAEMDENFNYLNDYGVIATTNEYYVLAGFSGDSPSDGSKAAPYPTIAAAISAADADGHTATNPAFIILLSDITESFTMIRGGIWLTSDYGTGTQGSVTLTGSITIDGGGNSLLNNHFSISNLRIVAPSSGKGIYFTGENPQRLYMRDLWIDASGTTGSCIYADNTGTGSVCYLNTAHLTHSGSGDVYCFDAEYGGMYLTDIETSGSNVQVAKVGANAVMTVDSSELDATGEAAFGVYGGVLVITRSTINNTFARGHGIACNTNGSLVTIGDCIFNIDPDNLGKAVFGKPGTSSNLYYQYIAFFPDSNRGISAGTITAVPLETTFA